ncbi:hypothetical protein E2C01_001137 [Portunus trituberculatus]|uniref:Uncharacterized protein n=1 Tax=Portunus trituberculatus TaxID=210409 RepID=A0A5B7CG67_PORTR|nr:hypothetical protein [Portunus trituberculatus]
MTPFNYFTSSTHHNTHFLYYCTATEYYPGVSLFLDTQVTRIRDDKGSSSPLPQPRVDQLSCEAGHLYVALPLVEAPHLQPITDHLTSLRMKETNNTCTSLNISRNTSMKHISDTTKFFGKLKN